MRVGAVVLLYRFWPEVEATLEALRAQTKPPVAIVVVDNDPAAGGAAEIRRSFPGISVIESPSNGGYAAGMNLGVMSIGVEDLDAVLLLTHDCLLAPDALEQLAERLGHAPDVGVVGPLTGLRSAPELVFSGGCAIDPDTWDMVLETSPRTIDEWSGRPPERCRWLGGYCQLFRSDALQAAGPIDEDFFLYFEDVDHQLRVGSLGWDVECVPSALAWQEPGIIPLELWTRNNLRFLARHAPVRIVARRLAADLADAVRDARRGDRARAAARLRGVSRFLVRRWGPVPPRRSGEPHVRR